MAANTSPRTLVVSQRHLDPAPHRSLVFQLEDLVVRVDGARLLAPKRMQLELPPIAQRIAKRLNRSTGLSIHYRPPIERHRLDESYEVLLVMAQRVRDLEVLDSIDGWQDRCAYKVAWIEELWVRDVAPSSALMRNLSHFDQVCLGVYWTVEEARRLLPVPVEYFAPAVDALSFCPEPDAPRPIDVYAMGRRAPATHRAFLRKAERDDFFYLYDSGWATKISSSSEHRRLLASLLTRTRYLLVNPAKRNRPQDTGGQEEVGLRFFEGAAAGAVLLGEIPNVPSFADNFDWPDAVLPMEFDEDDVEAVLAEYDADPQRLERARRNNVAHTLERHDFVYRWETILKKGGLAPRQMAEDRKRQLAERAREFAQPHVTLAKPVA